MTNNNKKQHAEANTNNNTTNNNANRTEFATDMNKTNKGNKNSK